jgi:transforming growth factor-beta-induced protein
LYVNHADSDFCFLFPYIVLSFLCRNLDGLSTIVPSGKTSVSDESPFGTGTVVDIAIGDPDTFSSLVDFATLADLVGTLSKANGITLFAPTNDAFAVLAKAAPDIVSNLQKEEWQDHLEDLLFYHVLPDVVLSSAITDGLSVTTLNTEDIDFTVTDGGGTFVNTGVEVVAADVDAKNGVIHVIDTVLIPSWVSNSIVDLAKATSDLSTLVDLVVQAGLADTLSEAGPYTVFAPTNEAFVELLEDGTSLSADQVSSILTYHVVSGIYPESALVDGLSLTTVQGEELIFRSLGTRVFANDEKIIIPNILANNGIVHVIKGVLIPEE